MGATAKRAAGAAPTVSGRRMGSRFSSPEPAHAAGVAPSPPTHNTPAPPSLTRALIWATAASPSAAGGRSPSTITS